MKINNKMLFGVVDSLNTQIVVFKDIDGLNYECYGELMHLPDLTTVKVKNIHRLGRDRTTKIIMFQIEGLSFPIVTLTKTLAREWLNTIRAPFSRAFTMPIAESILWRQESIISAKGSAKYYARNGKELNIPVVPHIVDIERNMGTPFDMTKLPTTQIRMMTRKQMRQLPIVTSDDSDDDEKFFTKEIVSLVNNSEATAIINHEYSRPSDTAQSRDSSRTGAADFDIVRVCNSTNEPITDEILNAAVLLAEITEFGFFR